MAIKIKNNTSFDVKVSVSKSDLSAVSDGAIDFVSFVSYLLGVHFFNRENVMPLRTFCSMLAILIRGGVYTGGSHLLQRYLLEQSIKNWMVEGSDIKKKETATIEPSDLGFSGITEYMLSFFKGKGAYIVIMSSDKNKMASFYSNSDSALVLTDNGIYGNCQGDSFPDTPDNATCFNSWTTRQSPISDIAPLYISYGKKLAYICADSKIAKLIPMPKYENTRSACLILKLQPYVMKGIEVKVPTLFAVGSGRVYSFAQTSADEHEFYWKGRDSIALPVAAPSGIYSCTTTATDENLYVGSHSYINKLSLRSGFLFRVHDLKKNDNTSVLYDSSKGLHAVAGGYSYYWKEPDYNWTWHDALPHNTSGTGLTSLAVSETKRFYSHANKIFIDLPTKDQDDSFDTKSISLPNDMVSFTDAGGEYVLPLIANSDRPGAYIVMRENQSGKGIIRYIFSDGMWEDIQLQLGEMGDFIPCLELFPKNPIVKELEAGVIISTNAKGVVIANANNYSNKRSLDIPGSGYISIIRASDYLLAAVRYGYVYFIDVRNGQQLASVKLPEFDSQIITQPYCLASIFGSPSNCLQWCLTGTAE